MTPNPDRDARIFIGDGKVADLMRAYDWRQTPVGDPETWSFSLRTVVRIMLGSRFAMWMAWGPELTFFCNDAYAPTLGVKQPWAIGKPASEVWAEIWPDIGPRIESVLSTGNATWDEELPLFLLRSGFPEETYHTFSYSPAADDDGTVAGMLCVVSEVTDKVIGERRITFLGDLAVGLAAASTERELFEALERTTHDRPKDAPFLLAYLLDTDGRMAWRVAATGIDFDDRSAPDVVDLASDDLPWPFLVTDGIQRIGRVGDLESRMDRVPSGPWSMPCREAAVIPIAQQGSERPAGWLITGLNPFRQFDSGYERYLDLISGQIASALANARAYEAERRRSHELAKLDQAKTAFFSNISHELRTPLTLMLGTLEDSLANAHTLDDRHQHNLAVAERNSLRLLKLVNTLLEFSRIEAGRVQATFEPIDLAAFTADLASNFRSATDRAGLRLNVHCVPVGEPVFVDRDMWEKIVLNLISNALKFTFHGEINVELRREGGRVRLCIRDTGTGISDEARSRLFERFYRVDGAVGRTYEGTGIGLALVQELVSLHGGAVEVQSKVGRGSEFSVVLPLGSAHLPPERVREVASAMQGSRHARPFVEEAMRWLPGSGDSHGVRSNVVDLHPASENPSAGARIVLADDNADLREYVTRLLSGSYQVEATTDGVEALEAIRRERPEMVLTDVMMPRMDGFGLLSAIRDDAELADLPVIVLSARAGEEAKLDGLNRGADDYLIKPFTASELLARVALHIRLYREERAANEAKEALSRSLAAERARLASIFEQTPAVLALLQGPELVFVEANPAYQALVPGRQIIGKPLVEALPEIPSQGYVELLEEVLRTGVPYVGRESRVYLQHDPSSEPVEHYMNFTYQPVLGENDEVTGVLVCGLDVTSQVRARQALESLNEQLDLRVRSRTEDLEHAVRELESFNYTVSHDLRAPLRAIVSTSRILLEEAQQSLDAEHRRLLHRQSENAVRLGKLIDDLLQFSRLARMPISRKPIDITAVVEEAAQETRAEFPDRTLVFDIQRGMHADADPQLVRLVLHNLLNNACKFSPAGGTIRVWQSVQGDQEVFNVSDEGVGFDMAFATKLFRPFERLVRDDEFPGTGIGLANVERIVHRHGGRIWADSKPGCGATLSFTLS